MKVDNTKKIWEQLEPSNWCQGEGQRGFMTDEGSLSAKNNDNVVKACSWGWVGLRYGDAYEQAAVLRKHVTAISGQSVSGYNDTHTFEEVKAVFKAVDL